MALITHRLHAGQRFSYRWDAKLVRRTNTVYDFRSRIKKSLPEKYVLILLGRAAWLVLKP